MTRRFVTTGAVTAAAIVAAAQAGGPATEWANPVSGDWNTASNWLPIGVPGLGDDVLLGLTGAYTVSLNANHAAATLTIANPDATVAINGFRTLTVGGDVANQGLIVVNPNLINSGTRLLFSADASLTGSGTVLLNANGATAELFTNTGVLLTQGAGHTISGRGRISAALANDGLVLSNTPGGVLTLSTNDKENRADIRAENGASISVEGIDLLQGPAGEIIADGPDSVAAFGTSTVDGGLIRSQNGGKAAVVLNSTFRDVTLEGPAEVAGFRTLAIEQGIVNDGVLTINPTGINTGTAISLSDAAPIDGSGEIVLANPSSTAEIRSTGAGVPVHGADHTIRGRGRISAAMINEGLISSDVPAGVMELTSQAKTNNARMEAVNAGILDISGITVTQASDAVIEADGSGSAIYLSGPTIVDGTLSSVNGGLVSVRLSTTVQDVVLEGVADVQGFRFLTVAGSLTNDAVITVNPTFINSGTGLFFQDGSVLGGAGRVVLANAGATSAVSTANGASMTHAAGHTIEGRGRIDAAMTNNGLINANVPGAAMEIVGNPKTNNGTMIADDGGLMNFFAVSIDQSTAGAIRAEGPDAVVDLTSVSISGGTLEAANGGLIRLVGGNATLNGVSLRGETEVRGFRLLDLDQGTTLDGRIIVNPTGINTGTGVRFVSEYTLEGQGVIRLANNTATAFVGALAGVPGAGLGEGIRLEGIGRVQVPLTVMGEIAPGLDGVGALEATTPLTFADTTTLEIEVSADQTGDRLTSFSTVAVDGTLDVSFVDGFNPPLSWTATIVTTAANGVTGRFDTVNAPQPADSRLEFRVVYNANQIRIGAFCRGDFSGDGILNFFDISEFIADYNAGDPAADIAAPFGNLNFFDIAEFISRYNTGCP